MDCLVLVDLEGITGVYYEEQYQWRHQRWVATKPLATNEVLAVLQGLDQSGVVDTVVVRDLHDRGYNLDVQIFQQGQKKLDKIKVVRYIGGQGYTHPNVIGDVGSVDAAIFVGFHSSSGQPEVSAHTFTRQFNKVTINGLDCTEVHILVDLIREAFNAPTVMVTGTPKMTEQLHDFLPSARIIQQRLVDGLNQTKESNQVISQYLTTLSENAQAAVLEKPFRMYPPTPFEKPIEVGLKIEDQLIRETTYNSWVGRYDLMLEGEWINCLTSTMDQAMEIITYLGLLTQYKNAIEIMKISAPLVRMGWRIQSKMTEMSRERRWW